MRNSGFGCISYSYPIIMLVNYEDGVLAFLFLTSFTNQLGGVKAISCCKLRFWMHLLFLSDNTFCQPRGRRPCFFVFDNDDSVLDSVFYSKDSVLSQLITCIPVLL